jgi:hypothetical protein
MIVGNEREIDVIGLMEVRRAIVEKLVEIKTAISAANEPIRTKIYQIAELKALIGFLKGIPTTHGKVASRRSFLDDTHSDVEYVAAIRTSDVESLTKEAKRMIDVLQTEIDAHNASTSIDVTVEEGLLY